MGGGECSRFLFVEKEAFLFTQVEFVLKHKPLGLMLTLKCSYIQLEQLLSPRSPHSQDLQNLFGWEFSTFMHVHVFKESTAIS